MWLLAQAAVEVEVTRNPYDATYWTNYGVSGLILFFVGVAIVVVWRRFTNEKTGYATKIVNAHTAFLDSQTEQGQRQTTILEGMDTKLADNASRTDNLHAAIDHGLDVAERHIRKHHGKDSDVIIDLQNVRRKLRGD